MQQHRIDFFGHSAFRITSAKGLVIWIDPWIENRLAPAEIKPDARTGGKTGRADLVLITHAHGDHLGNVISIARSPATEVVAVHEIQQYLLAGGLPNVIGMNIGGTYPTKGVKVTMTPAVHSSSIQNGNDILYGGTAAGFVVHLEDGTAIYHAGDTDLFGDMALIGELHRPQIAMLPIGDHYTMGPRAAAHAARLIGAGTLIPMHYGTFPVLTGTVAEFESEVKALGLNTRVVAIAPGEGMELQSRS